MTFLFQPAAVSSVITPLRLSCRTAAVHLRLLFFRVEEQRGWVQVEGWYDTCAVTTAQVQSRSQRAQLALNFSSFPMPSPNYKSVTAAERLNSAPKFQLIPHNFIAAICVQHPYLLTRCLSNGGARPPREVQDNDKRFGLFLFCCTKIKWNSIFHNNRWQECSSC